MNLARHAAVLWRFRAVAATGLVLGIVLAVLASYTPTLSGGPSLVSRGVATWSSDSALLVTQPGFPEGRVVLPTSPADGTAAAPKDELQFGDPNRFNALTDLYAHLATADQVLRRIPERPKASQVTAEPEAGLSGSPILPIIKLTTTAPTAAGARSLNVHTADALRNLLSSEQTKAAIGEKQRVELRTISAPSRPVMTSGPSHTASILALLLCLIGTVAVTHLLAGLRPAPESAETDDLMYPWDIEDREMLRTLDRSEHDRGAVAAPGAGGQPGSPRRAPAE